MTPEPLDSAPSHELTKPIDNRMTAVHGRFLLALKNPNRELLNPKNTDIPEIKQEDLQSDLSKQNFQLFNEASFNERLKQNGVSADKLDAAVDEWTTDTLEKINAASSFEAFDEETQTRWNASLAKLVHKSSLTDLTKDDIKKIYDIYCTDGKVSNIDTVIKDIMQNMGGKEELLQNLDCIEWFATMFGDVSSVMVRELAIAETRLEEPTFISDLNAKNSETQKLRTVEPTEQEESLLQFVYDNTKGEPQKTDDNLEEKKGKKTETPEGRDAEIEELSNQLAVQDNKDRDAKLVEPSQEFKDLQEKLFTELEQSATESIEKIPEDQKKPLENPVESSDQGPYDELASYAMLKKFLNAIVPHLSGSMGPGFSEFVEQAEITQDAVQQMQKDPARITIIAQRVATREMMSDLETTEVDGIQQGLMNEPGVDPKSLTPENVQKLYRDDPDYQVNRDHVAAEMQRIQIQLPLWEEALSGIQKTEPRSSSNGITKELIDSLPRLNYEAAQAFPNNLRRRIQKDGKVTSTLTNNTFRIQDTQTEIDMVVGDRKFVENAWFHTSGFTDWANKNNLPLFYLVPNSNHAQLLLKLNKDGYTYYDPLIGGEREGKFKKSLTFQDYIQEQINQHKLVKTTLRIDNQDVIQYKIPASQGDRIKINEVTIGEDSLYEGYLNEILPVPTQPNLLALHQLREGTYDLTLLNDPELSKDIVDGKLQQLQFNGKDCIPISFFSSVLRYLAKPGNQEQKKLISLAFEKDFGIRILTRDEMLNGLKVSAKDDLPITVTNPSGGGVKILGETVHVPTITKEFPADKVRLIGKSGDSRRIILKPGILEKANEELKRKSYSTGRFKEQYGLFVGKRYKSPSGELWTEVVDWIIADNLNSSGGELALTPENWTALMKSSDEFHRSYPELGIVGWAHTHPSGWEGKLSPTDQWNNETYYKDDNFAYVYGAGQSQNTPVSLGNDLTDTFSFFSKGGSGNGSYFKKHVGVYIENLPISVGNSNSIPLPIHVT